MINYNIRKPANQKFSFWNANKIILLKMKNMCLLRYLSQKLLI